MASTDYKDFLIDFVYEIIDLTKDKSLYSSGDAHGAGYRLALYSVLNLLEGQAVAWNLDAQDVGLKDFSPDRWLKEGFEYWIQSGGADGQEGSE